MSFFTDSQRAVLAEPGIATYNRGVIARVVWVLCESCQEYIPAGHTCPGEVAA